MRLLLFDQSMSFPHSVFEKIPHYPWHKVYVEAFYWSFTFDNSATTFKLFLLLPFVLIQKVTKKSRKERCFPPQAQAGSPFFSAPRSTLRKIGSTSLEVLPTIIVISTFCVWKKIPHYLWQRLNVARKDAEFFRKAAFLLCAFAKP